LIPVVNSHDSHARLVLDCAMRRAACSIWILHSVLEHLSRVASAADEEAQDCNTHSLQTPGYALLQKRKVVSNLQVRLQEPDAAAAVLLEVEEQARVLIQEPDAEAAAAAAALAEVEVAAASAGATGETEAEAAASEAAYAAGEKEYVLGPYSTPTPYPVPLRSLVVTELAYTNRHMNQFQALFYPSWKLVKAIPDTGAKVTVDLMAFCEPKACDIVSKACTEVPQGSVPDAHGHGKCFFQWLSNTYALAKYSYGLSLYFMTSKEFEKVVTAYDYVLRSDADALLLPGLRYWVPEFGSAVGHGYMGSDFTHKRLEGIAPKLGLKHYGIHSMQSTFYVRAKKVVPFANMLVNLSQHFYEEEFTPILCAEVVKQGGQCSWTDWYQPVSTLYATDLAANHLLGEPEFKDLQVTDKLDHCATSCWSWTHRHHGSLVDSPFKAREVGQVHMLDAKHWVYNGLLEVGGSGTTGLCRIARQTWPNLKIKKPADWGSQDESVNTYFLRVLANSLPKMCSESGGTEHGEEDA